MNIEILDQRLNQACLWQPKPKRKLHNRIEIGPIEEGWRNLRPYFPTPVKESGFVAPINALEGIEHFEARMRAIERLSDQQARDDATHRALIEQDKELPTIVDEFRANGFKAISLSSSEKDDDPTQEISNQDLEHAACRYGTAMVFGDAQLSITEAAPYMRRIEWERYMLACSLPIKVSVTIDGSFVGERADTPLDLVKEMGKRVKEAILRDWAYGPTPAQIGFEQDMDDLDPHETRRIPDEDNPMGPQELGLHNFSDDEEPLIIRGRTISQGPIEAEPSEWMLESWADDFDYVLYGSRPWFPVSLAS